MYKVLLYISLLYVSTSASDIEQLHNECNKDNAYPKAKELGLRFEEMANPVIPMPNLT